ncbi:MAG: hypothetical protein HQ521_07250 [Bacteroidetes bacterium]|nr:hypothetical protein [Bacteroidota bacterium]
MSKYTREIDITSEKDLAKSYLDKIAFSYQNILDNTIDTLIGNLKDKLNDLKLEQTRIYNLGSPVQVSKSTDEFWNFPTSAEVIINEMNIRDTEEELFVLFEVKIIYAFKHLEINIKRYLSTIYKDKYDLKRSKWDSLIVFLKSNKIDLKSLDDYSEINQLREANNYLKHSNEINNFPKSIPEFTGIEKLSYTELEYFYDRIKGSPQIFLTSLTSSVYSELYIFNEAKINDISTTLANRMDKPQAIILAENLIKRYE